MNTSFIYHAFGIRGYTRFATQYEDNAIIFKLQTPRQQQRCSCCKSRKVILFGRNKRRVRTVPIGAKRIYLELHLHRLQCKECGKIGLIWESWVNIHQPHQSPDAVVINNKLFLHQ